MKLDKEITIKVTDENGDTREYTEEQAIWLHLQLNKIFQGNPPYRLPLDENSIRYKAWTQWNTGEPIPEWPSSICSH